MAKQSNGEQIEKEQPRNYIVVATPEEVILHPFTASIFCTAAEATATIKSFAQHRVKVRAFKECE